MRFLTALLFAAFMCVVADASAQVAPTPLALGRDLNGNVLASSYPACDNLITIVVPTAGTVLQITPPAGTTDLAFQPPVAGTVTYGRGNGTTFPGFATATSVGWEKNPGQRNITMPFEGGKLVFYSVTSDTDGTPISYCNYKAR